MASHILRLLPEIVALGALGILDDESPEEEWDGLKLYVWPMWLTELIGSYIVSYFKHA